MDLTDGKMRGLDDDDNLADRFKELMDKLEPNEVGVFGQTAQIEKLQRLVQAGNAAEKKGD